MRMYAIIMIMGNGDYLAYLAFLSDEGMLLAVFWRSSEKKSSLVHSLKFARL